MEAHDVAVMLGRMGGVKGGPARAAALSPKRRSEIASRAVATRWRRKTEADRQRKGRILAAGRARRRMTRQIEAVVDSLGLGFKADELRAAVLLLKIARHGLHPDLIADLLGYDRKWVRVVCKRIVQNNVWHFGRLNASDWFDLEIGGVAFTLDVLVAVGLAVRVPSSGATKWARADGQMKITPA